MAEIKNTFVKSKMNKDLDDRILPNGQYRDAQNVSISKSEESDVGALENVLGNALSSNLGLDANCNLNIIGKYMDDTNNRMLLFLTDYTDSSPDRLSNFSSAYANHYILSYYPELNTVNTLVSGAWLNFSKTHPIYGVNLLEDLLFWTDNRNQPRKINIASAESSSLYYVREDEISVAKYYPWQPIYLLSDDGIPVSVEIVDGGTGYASTAAVTTTADDGSGSGLTVNIVTTPPVGPAPIDSATVAVAGTGYENGEIVNITGTGDANATCRVYTTLSSTMQDVTSQYLPDPTVTSLTLTAGGTGYTNGAFASATTTGGDGVGLTVSGNVIGNAVQATPAIVIAGVGYTNGDLVTLDGPAGNDDAIVQLTVTSTANPYYDANWPGDPNYLKEKFVRFSYRFKFDDGEYSLMAPFTQPCFIPKQDGYFISHDEDRTFKSTEVDFMENKVNEIILRINSPVGVNWVSVFSILKVTEVEILYKESNGLAVKVVDTIPFESFGDDIRENTILEYKYQSKKPIKVLPEREIIRTSDKVPIRAMAQEVSGNRVIYGNFADKHSSPNSLDYNVAASIKNSESSTPKSYVRKEYQNHTLKQNRSYQVGIILCDKYGRQSDVILSSADSSISTTKKGSTIYHPYKTSGGLTNAGLISQTDTWPGDSLKVTFNTLIPSSVLNDPGYPGLYSATNPLGWYSYKVVVKQTQQGYYNVYFPGILNGWTYAIGGGTPATSADPIGHMVLTGDNINKVPKDLKDIGPNQNQFKSGRPTYNEDPSYYQFDSYINRSGELVMGSTIDENTLNKEELALLNRRDRVRENRIENSSTFLFGRVTNYMRVATSHNKRINPGSDSDSVVAIGSTNEMGLVDPTVTPATSPGVMIAPELYDYQSNPFIGRIELKDITLGATYDDGGTYPERSCTPELAIYETEPFRSELDIFWETSTSGLISDLNTDITDSDNAIPTSIDQPTTKSFTEFTDINVAITNTVYARNGVTPLGGATMILSSVLDAELTNVTSNFNLIDDGGGGYHLELAVPMYFQSITKKNRFTVYVQVTNSTYMEYFAFDMNITNLPPVIMNVPVGYQPASTSGGLVYTWQANNGARDNSVRFNELSWVLDRQYDATGISPVNYFYSSYSSPGYFLINNIAGTPAGNYGVVVKVTDGGGLTSPERLVLVTVS